jgi:S-formylglutathione hydrolase FrmB
MILRGTFVSDILKKNTGLVVIAPDRIDDTKKLQVGYLLHGLFSSHYDWVDNTMLPVFAAEYNAVLIMPDAARSMYANMKFGQNFFDYVCQEVPDMAKKLFNVSLDREDSAIIGGSMGGYGALKCALTYPEKFGKCAALSSACLFLKEGLEAQRQYGKTEEFKARFGERLLNDFEAIYGPDLEWTPGDEISELAKTSNLNAIKPDIYCACGEQDMFIEDHRRFKAIMDKLNYNFHYEEFEGRHDWTFFSEGLRRSLEFCFQSK